MRLAATIALLASGCTMTPSARRTTMVVGAATAVAGILVTRSGVTDADANGMNEWLFDDDFGAYALGLALVTGGIAVLLAGATSTEQSEPAAPVAMPVAQYRTPSTQVTPLPELPVTEVVWNLARSIRLETGQGHCAAAWTLWRQLARLDRAYAAALRDGPVMEHCPRLEGTTPI